MTRKELIKCLTLLKEQARNSGANTFVWDITVDSFNYVIDMAIKPLEQEPKTGHWMKQILGYKCSNCTLVTNEKGRLTYNYYPNCGAKMVEPQESEEV